MSKALLQFKQGEYLQVGDREYTRIAGEFELINDEAVAVTAFGILSIDKSLFCARLVLPDDFDMATLDPYVIIVN